MTPAELSAVARIYAFGQLIGNGEMHFGNLSFFADDTEKPTLTLAPVYDMLPTMWRPSVNTGELNALPVATPVTIPSYARDRAEACEWAIAFWQQAAMLDALDEPLR
ncbi:MAG: HipA domain-containing protein [Aeromicrobium sp.]|nr:HipA domain-containing protein [Burkholderiales bacterium]